MKLTALCVCSGMLLFGTAATTYAENRWSNYRGVDSTRYQYHAHDPQHHDPQQSAPQPGSPQHHSQHYPNDPQRAPQHPHSPAIQNGISIQYQAPTTIIQNSQTYRWLNGDPNTARIESSRYGLITDWKRLGLPAPPNGMYWIYEHGRYVLVPNR